MPPRPGGVAMATMVSVVENTGAGWRLVIQTAPAQPLFS